MHLGFTLTEVLVSITIFLTVSMGMMGIYSSATTIYHDGERGRATNNDALRVFNVLERDMNNMVPYESGGYFYAWNDDNANNGNCVIGWTAHVQDPAINSAYTFILWGINQEGHLKRTELSLDNKLRPTALLSKFDNPTRLLDSGTNGVIYSHSCLHFGTWLVGTSHQLNSSYARSIAPEPGSFWKTVLLSDGNTFTAAEPSGDTGPANTNYYTNLVLWGSHRPQTPTAMRFTVVLTANKTTHRNEAILKNIDDQTAEVVGVQSFPAGMNALMLIENKEWVAYERADGNTLYLNTQNSVGLLGGANNGRAVLGSQQFTMPTTGPLPTVRFGRYYSFTRHLGQ